MSEIKTARSRTSAHRTCNSSRGTSCDQFGTQPPSSIWPQTDHYTGGVATAKSGAFCLPTACPLHSRLLEVQDESKLALNSENFEG